MKKRTFMIVSLTMAALLLSPVFAYASGTREIKAITSSAESDYTIFSDKETLKKDVGFVPKLAVSLATDFQFEYGYITESFSKDSNGNVANFRKGISLKYKKTQNDNTQSFTLSAEPNGYQTYFENSTMTKYGDYHLYSNEEHGNSVSWTDDEVFYMLMDVNKKVSMDELKSIAKELIDKKAETGK